MFPFIEHDSLRNFMYIKASHNPPIISKEGLEKSTLQSRYGG